MAVFKRDKSKYYWMKFTHNGQLIQQSTKHTNKGKAKEYEIHFRSQLALGNIGIKVATSKVTIFKEAIESFENWSNLTHSEGTKRRYWFSCQHLLKAFGQKNVKEIDTDDLNNYILKRSKQISRKTGKVITRETINNEIIVLKIIFKRLTAEKKIRENPAIAIKLLPENDKTFHVITPKEQKLYLFACPQPLRDVATLMLQTGMRCEEVYTLKRENIHLEKNQLRIVKGKTKASIRNVHLSDTAIGILKARLERFDGDYLFPQNDIDGRESTRSLDVTHKKVVENLGFKFRLYDCRHTFATRALERGVDLVVLASILGHTDLKTLTRYAHPSEDLKAEAIKKMSKIA